MCFLFLTKVIQLTLCLSQVSLTALSCSHTRDVCPGNPARTTRGDRRNEGHQLPGSQQGSWILLRGVAVPWFSGVPLEPCGNRTDCHLLPLHSVLPLSREEQLIYSAGWAPLGCDLSFVLGRSLLCFTAPVVLRSSGQLLCSHDLLIRQISTCHSLNPSSLAVSPAAFTPGHLQSGQF